MKLTVTGSGGFVGSRLLEASAFREFDLQKVSLREAAGGGTLTLPPGDVLVHLAAIAHSNDPNEQQVVAVNRDLAIATARQAIQAGYSQFIFLSSALVWGAGYESVDGTTVEKPDSAYGKAKLEAESNILSMQSSSFKVTILRPPLVYGPGVKGNLAKLMHALRRWPVCPLGVSNNHRSLLHVDNLVALILYLAANGVSGKFFPADETTYSTLEIIEQMAGHMPRHAAVVAIPRPGRWLLRRVAPGAARRLFGSFVIHDNAVRESGFIPPFTPEDGFSKMVAHYLGQGSQVTPHISTTRSTS